jgi:hypothetical protein
MAKRVENWQADETALATLTTPTTTATTPTTTTTPTEAGTPSGAPAVAQGEPGRTEAAPGSPAEAAGPPAAPGATPAAAAADWVVKTLTGWSMAGIGSVSLTTEVPAPGGTAAADAAAHRFKAFEDDWRQQCRNLPEFTAAVAARQRLAAARERRAALAAELSGLEGADLDVSNGELAGHATQEAALRDQLAVVDKRLPAIEAHLGDCRRQLATAAGLLRTAMRMQALDTAIRRRDALVAALAAGGRLDELLVAALVADSLGRGLLDPACAEGFANHEVPSAAGPPATPPEGWKRPDLPPPGAWVPQYVSPLAKEGSP